MAVSLPGWCARYSPRRWRWFTATPTRARRWRRSFKGLAEVVLPQDGVALSIVASERGGRRVLGPPPSARGSALPVGMGEGAPLDAAGLEQIWQLLNDGSGVQTFSLRELVRIWYGRRRRSRGRGSGPGGAHRRAAVLAPVAGAAGLWRLRPPIEVRRDAAAGLRGGAGQPRPDQMAIQALIDHHLGHAPDLYRRSVDATSGSVTLGFFFPDVASQRYAEQIAALAAEAGVAVALASEPHQQALADAALAALPAGLTPMRSPSLKFALRTVQLRCEGAATPEAIQAAEAAFHEQTGWRLEAISAASAQQAADQAVVAPSDVEPVQQRIALDTARELFPSFLGCYKIGLDAQALTLTLRFYFPELAATQHAERLAQLAAATGWTVKVHPQAHQDALQRAAAEALPRARSSTGGPRSSRNAVWWSRATAAPWHPEQVAAAQSAFHERTGWTLALSGGG